MTEAEAMLGAGKNETSALGAWIYQGTVPRSHELASRNHWMGACSGLGGVLGNLRPIWWEGTGTEGNTEIVLLTYTIIVYRELQLL